MMHSKERVLRVCSMVLGDISFSKNRKSEIIYKKHIVRYMLRSYTDSSLSTIGSITSCSHANVLNSIRQANNLYATDVSFRKKCDKIESYLADDSHIIIIDSIKYTISLGKLTEIFKIIKL